MVSKHDCLFLNLIMEDYQNTPERIAFLILLYLHKRLTNEQADELDAWVEVSNENMEIFEELSDVETISILYQVMD